MIFSKSFGYALRGILYIAESGNLYKKVRVEDISKNTGIPKHFLGKIMNKLVKANVLSSIKGPSGGFFFTDQTVDITLLHLFNLFDGTDLFDSCVLHMRSCTSDNACPLHHKVEETRQNIRRVLANTKISDLLADESHEVLRNAISK